MFPEDFDYNSNYNNYFKRTDLIKMRNDLYYSEKLSDDDIFQLHTAINVKIFEINEELAELRSEEDILG